MVNTTECPCNMFGMVYRLSGLFFIIFVPLLANFGRFHLVSWQDRKPGEGMELLPGAEGWPHRCLVLAVLQDAVRKEDPRWELDNDN